MRSANRLARSSTPCASASTLVGPIADQVKDQASAVAQQQMTSAAEGLDSAAGAVNAVGDRLRENNLGELSQYTDLAAEQIEKLATWLRTTTPDEIAHDIEDFAKKQSAVFVAGALALGLIGVRFLRSTSQNRGQKSAGDEERLTHVAGQCFRCEDRMPEQAKRLEIAVERLQRR